MDITPHYGAPFHASFGSPYTLENLATGTRVDHFTNGQQGTVTIYDKSKVSIGVIDNDGVINLAWLLMI